MRVLFCNIASMRFYQGIIPGVDEPVGGGSWVKKEHNAGESNNFRKITFFSEDGKINSYCFGVFVQKTASLNLHIERIEGCKLMKNEPSVDGVLVVWCAASRVVGWYKNATVYRYDHEERYTEDSGNSVYLFYNVEANAEDCVLLPEKTRRNLQWYVPHVNKEGATFGFGQANVWYAQDESARDYVKKMTKQIFKYSGDNWACGSIMPVCIGDHVTVSRSNGETKIEFSFIVEEEGSRPPVHDLCVGKCVGDSFQYNGRKYTVTKVEIAEEVKK